MDTTYTNIHDEVSDDLRQAILRARWGCLSEGQSSFVLFPRDSDPILQFLVLKLSKFNKKYAHEDLEKKRSLEFNYEYYKVVMCGFLSPDVICDGKFVILPQEFIRGLSVIPALKQLDLNQNWGVIMENFTLYFCPFQPSLAHSGYFHCADRPHTVMIEIKPKEPVSARFSCSEDNMCNNCKYKSSKPGLKSLCTRHCALRLCSLNLQSVSEYVSLMLKCRCSQIKLFIDGQMVHIKQNPSSALAYFISGDAFDASNDSRDHQTQLNWTCTVAASILIKSGILNEIYSVISSLRDLSSYSPDIISPKLLQKFTDSSIEHFKEVVNHVKRKEPPKTDILKLAAASLYASLKDLSIFIVITNSKSTSRPIDSSKSETYDRSSVVINSKEYTYITKVIDVNYKPAASLGKYVFYSKNPLCDSALENKKASVDRPQSDSCSMP